MWFTRISLHNPVLATMVMFAFVVLGLFSYQRLKIDQFPNIDFPVVVVTTEYPGASPEIIESEVSKKIEEGVNAIAVHPRTRSQQYTGKAPWQIIKLVVDTVKIPVTGNGDVKSHADARRMMLETGCKTVMIGRGV